MPLVGGVEVMLADAASDYRVRMVLAARLELAARDREPADPRAEMLVAVGVPVRHQGVQEAADAGEQQADVADDPGPEQVPDARRGSEARVNV
jgi:hypothetical protein